MSYFYLASPYSRYHLGYDAAASAAARAVGRLAQRGIIVYSPIAHCHLAAKLEGPGTSHLDWEQHNKIMLENSAGLIVLKLEGWESSKGIEAETSFARERGKNIYKIGLEDCLLQRKEIFDLFIDSWTAV